MYPRTIHTPEGDVNYGSWFKIGMTEQEDAEVRVKQQDGTSNPESLITQCIFNGDRYFDLEPYDITALDAEQHLHGHFREKGREVRLDASREWFECSMEEIREAIQHIIDPEAHKIVLKLMPHQEEAYKFICDKFDSGVKQVLLNHKPRSGKTFITYKYLLERKPKNVLLFTNFPVLNNQWIYEALKIKGMDYDFINMSKDEVDEVTLFDDRPNFVLCSFQDGKGGEEIFGKKKFELLKKINWDLLIIDECHKAKETSKTDALLNKINFDKLLGLSATPTKNLVRGTFEKENIHVYNLVDEKRYKEMYPDIYTLPDISHWMYNVPDSVRKELKYYSEEEQFNWAKFSRVEDGRLVYKNDWRIFLMWLAGYYGGGINSPFKKFDANSVLLFVQNTECQQLLLDLLNEIPFYKENYNVHFTNSMVNGDSTKLLEKTKTTFIPRDGKKCIVIANRQLTTGITLRYCDMVMFMNDWESIDEYIQASFRCQSPLRGKKTCQVIDFTPYRTFNILNRYVENNTVFNGKSIDTNRYEFLNSVTLFESSDSGFKKIDLQAFKERVVDAMDISSKNFFGSYLIKVDDVRRDCDWIYSELGHIESGADKAEIKERLDDNEIEKGKTKETYKEKKDKKESDEKSKRLLWALENIEYFLGKTFLLSIYSAFKHDSIEDCFDHIHKMREWENNYINALSLDGKLNNIDFEIAEIVYRNYINNELLNDRILTINTKVRKLIYTKNKSERVINIQKVLELIDSYVGVSKVEKKLLGEVFTPFALIEEMLDTLPKEDWFNPDLKWFGPSAGIGNFQICIIKRLMDGLKEKYPNEDLRYKHIIENQIYINEYQSKNLWIYLQLFDPNNEYKLNYNHGDFLTFDFEKKWECKPNRIIENPPYQEINNDGNRKTGGSNLYCKFIRKSYNLIDEDDHILFITPPTWMNTGSDEIDIFSKNQIIYLNVEECSKYFNVGSKFSYFLLKKTKPLYDTDVICSFDKKIYKDKILLKDFSYLPMLINKNAIEIYNKVLLYEEKLDFRITFKFDHRRDFISKEESEKFKFKLKHTSKQYRYSSIEHPDQNTKKILVSRSGNLTPVYDDGICGTTDGIMYVPVKSKTDGEKLIRYLDSKLIKFILKIYKWNGFNDVTILKSLPYPNIEKIDDESIYNYFKLNVDEIKFIENIIK